MIATHLQSANSIRLGLADEILFVEDHLFVTATRR